MDEFRIGLDAPHIKGQMTVDDVLADCEEAAGGVPGRRGMVPVDDAGQDGAESPHETPARPAASSQPGRGR